MRMQIIKCNWNNRSSIAYIDLDYLFKKKQKKNTSHPSKNKWRNLGGVHALITSYNSTCAINNVRKLFQEMKL